MGTLRLVAAVHELKVSVFSEKTVCTDKDRKMKVTLQSMDGYERKLRKRSVELDHVALLMTMLAEVGLIKNTITDAVRSLAATMRASGGRKFHP